MAGETEAFDNRAASAKLGFTPGPWQSQHEFDWEGLCTIIGNIDGDPASPTYTTICDIDEGCDEFLANRNLICAAPSLFEALKWCVNNSGECLGDHPAQLRAYRAILAQAGGK